MIGIINYGVGNLQSVKNSLDYLNISNLIVNDPQEIKDCDKLILPGVGAFRAAMEKLNDLGFTEEIKRFAGQNKPVLGICLGMQLLFNESYEHGHHNGLGLIDGKVSPFSEKVKDLPLPQIGWNNTTKISQSPILKNIENDFCFYFVHSFYCEPTDKSVILANSNYGVDFPAVVGHGKIFGCQFHPEKSQSAGLQILKNFSNI